MEYYAKSKNAVGHQETVREHLTKVAKLARSYGDPIGLGNSAELAGYLHDFGKYTEAFQNVLRGTAEGIDHAIGGAAFLEAVTNGKGGFANLIEAINGHHDGLVEYGILKRMLYDIMRGTPYPQGNASKTPSIQNGAQLQAAYFALRTDFPNLALSSIPKMQGTELESMLHARMLFSCLVDADYSASAQNDDETYLDRAEDRSFDAQELLERLYAHRHEIKSSSNADSVLNSYRDQLFDQCGRMGCEPEGLFTLTAPTGTGKTLALMHFALRHCLTHGKKRIIIVLPFLTLAEQTQETYQKIVPSVLVDHSQSDLPEQARELAARWSAPVIITTSVRFFETLFSNRPTMCRKLHNIADSVVIFDEAQSLPTELTPATVQAVNALCSCYHTTMVFSTATQPDYAFLNGITWQPREILPDHARYYKALQRVDVEWRTNQATPLEGVAGEMANHNSVCVIVNLRRHARQLVQALDTLCPEEEVFFLTTDLCPEHRSMVVKTIRERQKQNLPCRVVATQCIEAGVDLDFEVLYRALAPLDSIIQAAGRCNRNGRGSKGQVVVFLPEDTGRLYPDDRYSNAATIVQEMGMGLSVHEPENIREYYRRLFADEQGREKLRNAISARDYYETAKQYRLIDNGGMQVIVPYAGKRDLYDHIVEQLRTKGVTRALLHEAAPITITSFNRKLAEYAGAVPFARHKDDNAEQSNLYLLYVQNEKYYSDRLGLQLPQDNSADFFQ